jgi:hypothetical protein
MGYEFKINKNIIIIILFLFLFGIVIQLSRSNYLIRLNTGNGHLNNKPAKETSALTAQEAKKFKQDKLLIVFDPKNKDSIILRDNLKKTLDYMQKDYQVVPTTKIPSNISSYQDIIIAFENLDRVSDFTTFTDYAEHGGKVFFAIRPELDNTLFSIYRNLGIYELGDFQGATGVDLDSDLLLQGKNLKVSGKFLYNNSLSVHLSEACKVYAHTGNGTPLLWSVPYGKGQVMIFNGTMLGDKTNRGVISGSLSYLNNDYIYPIQNSKVVFIDDFPAPFPEGYNKDIYNNYKRDTATFFRDIWWQDMERSAVKNDVKYTGVLIETYNDKVKGSFEDQVGLENLKIFGRDLIKSGGEIGMHGYNHQSLTENQKEVQEFGYKAWPSEKDMAKSLEEAKEYFDEVFPNYTLRTYVPPSNVVSEEGKKAIQKSIPSIKILSSLYEDDPSAATYTQDPGINKAFTEMPRFTSGYEYSDENKWMIANNATIFGAFSHFVHPDDILDKERSDGKNWGELSKEYDKMLEDVKVKYPWMKSMTASDSAASLSSYLNAKVFISQKNDTIHVYINHFSGSLDFLLRSDKGIKYLKDCEVENVSEGYYLVHAKANKLEIQLGGKK